MCEWDKRDKRAGHEHRDKAADKHRHKSTTGSPSLEVDARRRLNYCAENTKASDVLERLCRLSLHNQDETDYRWVTGKPSAIFGKFAFFTVCEVPSPGPARNC